MKPLVIARANLVRAVRDRLGLFFVVLLPMILIVVLGLTYGGWGSARVGVVDGDGGPLAAELVAGISGTDLRLEVRPYGTVDELRDAVERGYVQLGLAIPAGYEAALRGGSTATVELVAQPSSVASAVRTTLDRAIADQVAVVGAARFAATTSGVSFDQALAAALAHRRDVAGVGVGVESVAGEPITASGFSIGAQSQVVLFMFLTSLTGATELIITRQLGISRRMLATPTSTWTIILGEALARVLYALFQGFFIVAASAFLFGVDWADALGTCAIVVVFGLVAAGAAMLIGSVASNPSQAGAIGPAVGLLLGLLGGTMVPPEVFPEAMRTISHLTPHAWAMDAFRELLLRDGTLVQILPQLAVLLGFAAALLVLAVARFRRVMLSGAI